MRHIEEHTLELYVLGAASVADRRPEIAAHLKACEGCRALVERIGDFYRSADAELAATPEVAPPVYSALARRPYEIEPFPEFVSPSTEIYPLTRVDRVRYLIRRHPIASAAGAFCFSACLFLALYLGMPSGAKDLNPATPHCNTATGQVEILNKDNDVLWHFPAEGLSVYLDYKHDKGLNYLVIDDIDHDGRNEVLTTFPFPGDSGGQARRLRVLRDLGTTIAQIYFMFPYKYSDRTYSYDFSPGAILTGDFSGTGTREILIASRNTARSPFVMSRSSASASEIGQYWHFGDLSGMYPTEYHGRPAVILLGMNDVDDESPGGIFPAMVLLDPAKVLGKGRSTTSPGFDFPPTDAELLYVRFPVPSINRVMGRGMIARYLRVADDHTLEISLVSDTPDGNPMFDYIFSKDFQCLDVKSTNRTDALYAGQVKEGKLRGTIDRAYRDSLRNAVMYWDGHAWTKDPVMVHHPPDTK